MEVDWYYFLLLFILIILSAIFSGSEVALFSLDKKKINEIKSQKGLLNSYIINLLENPRRLLVTILLGNTIVNVASSIVSVLIALNLAAEFNISAEVIIPIQILSLTILILIFGEITPKVWASKYPLQFAKIISPLIYWTGILVYPISKILTDVIRFAAKKFTYDKTKTAISSSEITELADIGVESGTIEEDEHELIHSLVSFKTVSVREVMTPRVDITAVPVKTSYNDLIKLITESGHSRIPLYNKNLDDIDGVIYAKDLLKYIGKEDSQNELVISKIARKVMFIPETKLISELLEEFQSAKMHVGIVVDEYGGTAGLISLEDILEEIVGEIRDEYDVEENEFNKIDENKFMALGKLPIDELNEHLDFDFASENDDYDTLGGFIFNHAGKIPDNNFVFDFEGYKFTVKEVNNNRITKILIERI